MTEHADERASETMSRVARETQAWIDENEQVFVCDYCCHPIRGRFATYTTKRPLQSTLSAITDDLGTASVDIGMSEDWAACANCDPVVAAGDPVALAEHALANRDVERVGPISREIQAVVRSDLVELFRAFYAGDPQRTEEER